MLLMDYIHHSTRKAAKGLRSKPIEISLEGTLSHAPSTPSMPADESFLGRCPECGEDISEVWILVEYEKEDGTEGVWTECPACENVVAPE
jgi:hypothetical protein